MYPFIMPTYYAHIHTIFILILLHIYIECFGSISTTAIHLHHFLPARQA